MGYVRTVNPIGTITLAPAKLCVGDTPGHKGEATASRPGVVMFFAKPLNPERPRQHCVYLEKTTT